MIGRRPAVALAANGTNFLHPSNESEPPDMSDPIPLEDDPRSVIINIVTDRPSVIEFELDTAGHDRPEGHVFAAVGMYLTEMALERITIDCVTSGYREDQFGGTVFWVALYTRAIEFTFGDEDDGE